MSAPLPIKGSDAALVYEGAASLFGQIVAKRWLSPQIDAHSIQPTVPQLLCSSERPSWELDQLRRFLAALRSQFF